MPREVCYEDVRKSFSIEDIAGILNLQLKKSGDQLKGRCPHIDGDGLVITPDKGVFFCHNSKCRVGGGTLELYAHVKGIYIHDAALELQKLCEPKELQPLPYLQSKHQSVQLFFPEDVAARMGIGYAPRGTMIGRVCFPMRDDTGRLVGYIGYGEYLKPRFKIGRFHL